MHKLPKTLKSGLTRFSSNFKRYGPFIKFVDMNKTLVRNCRSKSSFIFSQKIHRRRKVCQNSFVHQRKKPLSLAEFR